MDSSFAGTPHYRSKFDRSEYEKRYRCKPEPDISRREGTEDEKGCRGEHAQPNRIHVRHKRLSSTRAETRSLTRIPHCLGGIPPWPESIPYPGDVICHGLLVMGCGCIVGVTCGG